MSKEEKKEVVKFRDKTTVYSTGKTKHCAAGKEMKVHPILAKKLISDGKATEKAPKQ